ncbi:MAG TPA: hypothetical protein VM621_01295 [Luteibacter sp.]|nr:hypothetical protein [Luteibacter sp.]
MLRGELAKRSYVCKPINMAATPTRTSRSKEVATDARRPGEQMNGGKDYDSNFATRMRGQGVLADIIRKRVQVATRKAGLDRAWDTVLDTSRFVPPRVASPQGELF